MQHTQHTIEDGIYGRGNVWRFYTIEDAEQHDKESRSWKLVLEYMRQYLGKDWVDKKSGDKYKIIGIEDNEPYCDYYWILEDESHKIRYELANSADFYQDIKE